MTRSVADSMLQKLDATLLPLDCGPPAGTARQAAVLILLYPQHQCPHFVLTVRPETLSHHPGQISLPGGRMESNDGTLLDTALRETHEELGVKLGRVKAVGRLPAYQLRASGFTITPVVAYNPVRPKMLPNVREVAEVIEVPVSALLDSAFVATDRRELRLGVCRVTYFQWCGHHVWGATAHILADLANRLEPGLFGAGPWPGAVVLESE